jgi:hypothetical protein
VEAAEQRQWAERAETAERRLRRAAELWVLGDLDQEDYALVQRRADQDRIEALWHLRATPSVAALPTWEEMQGQACEWAAALSGSATPAQRRVFTALVERVERVRSEPRHYQVEVKWTVLGTSLVEAVLQARQAMR